MKKSNLIAVLSMFVMTALLSTSCSNRMSRYSSSNNYDDVYMNSEDVGAETVRTTHTRTYQPSQPSQNRTKVSTEYRAGTPKLVEVKTGETKRVK